MTGAGLYVESARRVQLGQQEIAFRYDEVLVTATTTRVQERAKEIAAQQGNSLTFMAKVDAREGNSAHTPVAARRRRHAVWGPDGQMSAIGEHFLAGQLQRCASFPAVRPNINSYKRFALGSFAPTSIAWAGQPHCALRAVGKGHPCGWRTVPAAT